MRLYDECFAGVEQMMAAYPCRRLELTGEPWPDVGKNQLIFRNDTAYELGGGTLPAVSGVALTGDAARVPCDEILLSGPDLRELKTDSPYARFALIRVREDAMGGEERFYQSVRKIEYTRYHLNPQGFMMRISAMNHRESVRIGKSALEKGLCFSKAGQLFLQAYHAHPAVEAVKLIFITQPDFPYQEASRLAERAENITKTLDHLLQNVKMDCNACGLQEICAEVEALCKTDFPGR